MVFIPLKVDAIASPRANRFVETVFTTPVERSIWLTAKVLVPLTLAGAYKCTDEKPAIQIINKETN
jgi:hypothetical protein